MKQPELNAALFISPSRGCRADEVQVRFCALPVETIAHLRDNGRLTIMFCSFDAKPLILRLYGTGETVLPDHPDFAELVARFPANRGTRSVIRLAVDRVSTSCGYVVPRMDLRAPRETLDKWADKKSDEELEAYRAEKNATSIDGLPALA
jgi:hypothetical protein